MSTKLNSMAVVTVEKVNAGTTSTGKEIKAFDKNEKQNVFLRPLAGTVPNRMFMPGTIAESSGFEVSKTYGILVTERDEDPQYGRQFDFRVVKEMSFMEAVQASEQMPVEVINVNAEVTQPAYDPSSSL